MELLWEICGIGAGPSPGASLVVGMLLAGLLGGAGHCSLMCGPFALAQVAERFGEGSRGRLWTAVLAPYQLGRITTYSGLGALAGGLGATAAWLAEVKWLSAGALLLAAAVFVLQAVGRSGVGWGAGVSGWLTRRRSRGVGLGLALGFLPCSLVYGALIAAAGAGGAVQGAAAMAAFGAGTVPALIAVGWLGLAAGRHWLDLARRIAPFLSLVSAAVLAVLAFRSL